MAFHNCLLSMGEKFSLPSQSGLLIMQRSLKLLFHYQSWHNTKISFILQLSESNDKIAL
jgi:hypothetical protein